ncbi:MAG: VOC family protein [Beijerinckiaceae bacterium]
MSAPSELIQDIAHLGNLELLTPKLEQSLGYFRDVLGMTEVARASRSIYLRAYGDYALTTLKLTEAGHAGPGCVSWRAVSPQALQRRVAALKAEGYGAGWSNGDVGRGPAFRFADPDGHSMEVYYEEQRYVAAPEETSTLKNMPQKFSGRGAAVRRIDHVALLARNVAENRAFLENLMGFRLREQVRFDGGKTEIGSWLSSNSMHHQIAYVADVKGGHGRLHHFALWVDEQQDVLRAANILAENRIFIEAGPSKHNNSQGFYLYSYEPGGNRIEIYSGSFLVLAPDWEPVTWNEEERGAGVYWGAPLPQSFLTYATPDIEAGQTTTPPTVPIFDPR